MSRARGRKSTLLTIIEENDEKLDAAEELKERSSIPSRVKKDTQRKPMQFFNPDNTLWKNLTAYDIKNLEIMIRYLESNNSSEAAKYLADLPAPVRQGLGTYFDRSSIEVLQIQRAMKDEDFRRARNTGNIQSDPFVSYLQKFMTISLTKKPGDEKKQELQEDEKRQRILSETKQCVIMATDEKLIGKLGRVFNDYPISYDHLPAIHESIWDKWLKELVSLINLNEVTQFIGEKGSTFKIGKNVQQRTEALLAEVIDEGCKALFDENGDLKKELIHLLGLEQVIANCESMPQRLEAIYFQILGSYCSQIFLSNTISVLEKIIPQGKARETRILSDDPDDSGMPADKIRVFFTFIENQISPATVGKFTPFFQKQMNTSLNRMFFKNLNHSAAESTQHIPLEQLSKIINDDIVKGVLLDRIIASTQAKPNIEYQISIEKVTFWIAVMDHYRAQLYKQGLEQDYLHMKAIYLSLKDALQNANIKIDSFSLHVIDRYRACEAVFSRDQRFYVMPRRKPAENKSEMIHRDITTLCKVNENVYLLNHLVQFVKNNMKNELSESEKKMLTKIKRYCMDRDLILKPTESLFNSIIMVLNKADKQAQTTAYSMPFVEMIMKYCGHINAQLNRVRTHLPGLFTHHESSASSSSSSLTREPKTRPHH